MQSTSQLIKSFNYFY